MPAEERGPDLRQARNVARSRGLAQRLATPLDRVRRLQTSLQAKAKAEPTFRFYTLWDKVCREDVLSEAYGACRRNGGVAGVDGETFAAIETAQRLLQVVIEVLARVVVGGVGRQVDQLD